MATSANMIPITLRTRGTISDRPGVRRLVAYCLERESAPGNRGLGIVLVGDRTMQRLNLAYRGIDRTTDVLSFPTPEAPPIPEEESERESALLGEVIVSIPRCLEQASERECDPGVEFVRLVVHGLLHVLGYDHESREDRALMVPRERRYRSWASRQGIGPDLIRRDR